ncbi:protein translocase subunit SecD [Nocardioides panacihumi]|uniref:Protein translocase subunit SecD n=1 Tax=Nocardioides panacihumi TaxID=400774 RepID=A0ABP5C8P3_9ACTN
MARKTPKPGRTLTVFFLALAIAYALVALGGTWKPQLGLDLQGGTRITLIAAGNPSRDNLNEARGIIDQRVNGSGVTEADVTTSGSNLIVVEIPGKNSQDLVETVARQAQMRFRLVACDSSSACGAASSSTAPTTPGLTAPSGSPSPSAPAAQRAPVGFGKADATPTPTTSPSADASSTASPSPSSTAKPGAKKSTLDSALAFMNNPPAEWAQKFNDFQCPTTTAEIKDDPNQPLITCNPDGTQKYLLSPAIIEGTDLTGASYGIPQNSLQYVVNLSFNGHGRGIFADTTGAIAGTGQLFAIVLDGQVISAAKADERISGGAQISGNFSEAEAKSLATSLKYGSLPISFEKSGTSVEVIGPTLAGNQLSAGLIAGAFGLGLVMLYCLIYYRGLGIVVLSSLSIAAVWTYAMVLLLSKTAGFTLTLPGIAGLIIAVGITADSFVIFFERIRDEMREGRSMRVAVETGWVRAKHTRIGASFVSLFSALILYIFATGVVKGFGFALGLSTLIDLAVLFWFTKPLVSWFARFRFFNAGGKLSGLSPETLGTDVPVAVGGKA